MKSKFKKRMIALTLCMVMVLSGSTSALADDANAGNTEGTEMVQQLQSEPVENEPAVASVEEPTSEPPIETPPAETTPTPEPTPETTPETTTPTPEPTTPTPEPTAPQAEPTPEPTTPTEEPAPAEETQEALELKKEIKDANGNVICTVTANIPEKTFNAKTSEVSMDVEKVEKATAETIQNLMKKKIADGKELGEHFLYKISFKVNGTTVEPEREIKLTFEQKNFKIEDVKKANVFYYNEAYSVAGNAEDEIIEITQKSEKLEELQNAGQSTEGIEDYDLTEISLNGDGTANKIQTEGRRSTIYGCYIEKDKPEEKKDTETPKDETKEEPKQEETKKEETEKAAVTMNYENDDVVVTVSAADKDVIPENAKLQVVPILSDDKETEAQYKEVEEKLNKKAENEAYDIAGFLAYDISFIDEDGNKVEPNGEVKVSMEYKKAAAPEGLDADAAKEADVTVMHFEEDAEGQVKEVVDMAEQNKVEAVETTEERKVQKVEFNTDSFSIYVVTWNNGQQKTITPNNQTIEVGETISLKSDQGNSNHKWKSSNDKIATVQENGQYATVTGVAAGKVTITHTYSNRRGSDTCTITVKAASTIKNFNDNDITAKYASMKETLQKETFTVTNWTRSSNWKTVTQMHTAKESEKWEWSDVSSLDAAITDEAQVWDGSRSLTHNFTNYLPNNYVTADEEKLYDSATWKRQGNEGATMYRFRGEFSLGENENPNDYAYTLAQVVGDKDKIYINDNIYVFVYPKDVTLTDNNFGNYLAFWTGTSSKHNPNVTFQGIKATTAKQETATGYRKLTDGWNIDAVDDNVANAIINGYKEGKKDYYVDVFVDDYAAGGGMYRLDLQKREVQKTEIKFLKVDATNISKGISGATFVLEDSSGNGRRYSVTSDANGVCSIKVVDGTYIMRESNAPAGYDAVSTSWTVEVENGKATTIKVNGKEIDKTADGTYFIKNTKTPGSVVTEKNLTHEKYIKKNEDGSYDLTLNVSGATGTETSKAKVDVLFVMDTSGSMRYKMKEDSRLQDYTTNINSRFYNQQKAITDAVSALRSKATVDAQFSVVNFASNASIIQGWTSGNINYPSGADGGTNYQAGLLQAKKLLDSARPDATKVVVFLSDGDVTYYYDEDGKVTGNGGSYDEDGMKAAQGVLKTLTMNHFYTVGVGPQTSYTHLGDLLDVVPAGVTKKSFNGTDAANLKNAFDTIVGSIVNLLCTNVTITDTLSEYAELIDAENPNFTITVKDGDGTEIGSGTNSLVVDGTTITALYDKENKKITLDFEDGYQLHEGYTYYVTAKIKPTDKAYYEYITSQYPHKGDANTDENPVNPKPGNDTVNNGTSSNQSGFHSNTKAEVTYTYNGETKTEDYKHPVVQVDPERVTHSVLKKWAENVTEADKEEVTVVLKAKVTEGRFGATPDTPVEITNEDYQFLPSSMTTVLNTDNNWQYNWENLPKYYYYEDLGTVKKTEIIYTVVEEENDKYLPEYEDIMTDGKVTGTKITNSLATAALDLKKTTENGIEISGAEFKLYKYNETETKWEQIGDSIVANNVEAEEALARLEKGRYKLEESKAPNGCMLLTESIFFKQENGTITLTNADGNAIEAEQTMWKLSTEDNTITLSVKNEVVYNLPEAGGTGIYWYMIGGMLLMLAAALILYKNRCKEVLKS